MKQALFQLGNRLYRHWPAAYEPLYFAYKAVSDRRERAFFRARLGPGMTVLDVGANIGANTRVFSALVGAGGHVIAFEPERENLERLRRVTRSLSNVRIVPAAVSARSGELELFVSEELNVDHHTYDAGDGRRRETVRAVRLDDAIPPKTRVDLIKMDIQGAEYQALKGAERVLRENAQLYLVFEFWPWGLVRAGCRPGELLDYLRDLGFSLVAFDERDPASVACAEGEYVNLVAMRGRGVFQ